MYTSLPRWSPDGKQIAFDGAQYGKAWKIFLISPQGGAPEELLSENRGEFDPAWSPDGKQIAFGRQDVPEAQVINILDLQTHQFSPLPGSQGTFSPRWSPDGRFLAALTGDSQKVMLYDFKTQKWTNWLSESRAVGFPNWSRDSKYLYYDSTFSNDQFYRRIKVGETKSEEVLNLKGMRRYGSWIGSWSGLAPDGTPLFVRDMSTQEIYALDVQLP
jgi:Tol biopolymer transport system component